MRTKLFAASSAAVLWATVNLAAAADLSTVPYDAPAALGAVAGDDAPVAPLFPVDEDDDWFAKARPYLSDPELQLAQREEPVTGSTPEEQVLRRRVQQAQTQQTYSPNYDSRQPYFYGPNSLLPGYGAYGGIGGYQTSNSCKKWFVSLAQTADYVTNLALPLVVTPGNVVAPLEDDYQFQTNLYAQYRVFGNQRHALTTGFNFYQSLHPSVEQLDLHAYSSLTQYTRAVSDRLTTFVNYTYSYYFLDHNSLLSRNAVGSGFTYRTRPRTFWTISGVFSDNYFRLDPTQTSDSYFTQVQRLQYIGCSNWYWQAGYGYGTNSAEADYWSYDVNTFSLGGGVNFGRCLKNNVYVLGTYGTYDFDAPNTPLGDTVAREDDVWGVTTRWSRNLGQHSTIFAQWTYFNSNSNIARQDFDSNLYSVGGLLYW